MAFIFIQSALPADLSSMESDPIAHWFSGLISVDEDTASFIIRKCGHFSEYAVLGVSLFFTVRAWLPAQASARCRSISSRHFQRTLPAWAIGVLYAVSDEIHQIFVEGRSCELRDICIDAAGVLLGVLLMAVVCRRK